ncbi:hypothetical protein [Cohnella panacarvi]|uniref:hypothetical protein n=1 Tax=Cohnella panacarvi TaxID=400776 RepID=UPI0004787A05|nr:hypothetical protein [Cohnella panacarvi]
MEAKQKKSYTVPVLLVCVVILAVLCILFYSSSLLNQQNEKSDRGMRLSEKYVFSQTYASLLREGAEQLLGASSETDRLQAKEKLGEARFASMEAVGLIGEALRMREGMAEEEAKHVKEQLLGALWSSDSPLNTVGEHEGRLTETERTMLENVAVSAAKAEGALGKFRAPSGIAGYRIMAGGGEWLDTVLEAKASLDAIADAVSKPILNP